MSSASKDAHAQEDTLTDLDVRLRAARPEDARVAARLIHMTMARVANFVFGSEEVALVALQGLFARPRTRFSYELSHVAEVDHRVVGVILAAPTERLQATIVPTGWAVVGILGIPRVLGLIWRGVRLARVPEGEPGEYYIAHLAVLPEYRGRGIGGVLLAWAEAQARAAGRNVVSLRVEIENERARAFYERHGYVLRDVHETPHLERLIGFRGLYRLVKHL